jgi:hypothetical protein
MHILSGIAILIGLLAIAATHTLAAIIVFGLLYLLWRSC